MAKDTVDRILKWAQFLGVVGTLLVGSAHYYSTFEKYKTSARLSELRTTRIERYLSSKDPNYWVAAQQVTPGDTESILKRVPIDPPPQDSPSK